jgi:hypothetical protein
MDSNREDPHSIAPVCDTPDGCVTNRLLNAMINGFEQRCVAIYVRTAPVTDQIQEFPALYFPKHTPGMSHVEAGKGSPPRAMLRKDTYSGYTSRGVMP